jgi:hypothetical protein
MITRENYVNRLEEMLTRKEPCMTCPRILHMTPWIGNQVWDDNYGSPVNNMHCYDDYICTMCRDFVGVKKNDKRIKDAVDFCPCCLLGEQDAIDRSYIAINMYRRGEHKWNK